MVREILAGAALVIAMTALSSCEGDRRTVTAPGTERTMPAVEEAPSSVLEGRPGKLPLPDGATELPLEELFRTVLVSYPDEIGTCYTQVGSRTRPVPFRVQRIQVELPREAWDEAAGESVFLQYRRFGRDGVLLRVARCRVPASRLAVDHLFDRFAFDRSSAGRTGSSALSRTGVVGLAQGWRVILGEVRPPVALGQLSDAVAMSMDGGDCPEGGNGTPECPIDGYEEIPGTVCQDQEQTYDPDTDECYCENGSEEPDCWTDWDNEDPDEPCDPAFEECCNPDFDDCDGESGGGGGGGGGGDGDGGSECGGEGPCVDPDEWAELCYPEQGCIPRYLSDWVHADHAMLFQALMTMQAQAESSEYCSAAVQKIEQNIQTEKLAIYDQRIVFAGQPYYGRYEGRQLLPDFDHIYVWSGAGKQEGDNFNLARTLAHEAFHALYRGIWSHEKMRTEARLCGGEVDG